MHDSELPAERDLYETVIELVGKSRDGDYGARNQMLARIHEFLSQVARRELESERKLKVGVSDIVQCSLIRVCDNVASFAGRSKPEFLAWLKTIVVNEIRRERRRQTTAKRDVRNEVAFSSKVEATPLSRTNQKPQPSPHSELVHDERLTILRDILSELPEEHATVIVLRNLESLTFAEIGAQLGRSENAVTKLWQRAIQRFQVELKKRGIDPEE